MRLSIATHLVNNTAGPAVITPTLLLFGSTPKIALPNLEYMALNQNQKFQAIELARKEM